ncbi:FlgB family protein [Jannaschia sp. M317]|uniref:FlgB family protein n=1 Tax=Jannaschia sp. M317 TaxID=2867011 RepID=UPI0021A77397|nr:FlgB family protein [Jannaschia sp. M317]
MTEIALLSLASNAARHAATRQSVIATNVANADTPGFRARDVAPFSAGEDGFALRRSQAGHFAGTPRTAQIFDEIGTAADPNGNTVSLEDQVLRGIETSRAHNRALTVYKASLDILRASIGQR